MSWVQDVMCAGCRMGHVLGAGCDMCWVQDVMCAGCRSKQYSGSQQETECLKQSLKNEAPPPCSPVHRGTGPQGHRVTGPQGYRATGPQGYRAIGL